jgi:N utilization substance protein A
MSVSESDDKQTEENQKISKKLAEQLGVDAEVAGVLIDEGFSSVDDIADADAASLETVEEFDFAYLNQPSFSLAVMIIADATSLSNL